MLNADVVVVQSYCVRKLVQNIGFTFIYVFMRNIKYIMLGFTFFIYVIMSSVFFK